MMQRMAMLIFSTSSIVENNDADQIMRVCQNKHKCVRDVMKSSYQVTMSKS